jgi:ACS family tartrate transporter-like MFS transporter
MSTSEKSALDRARVKAYLRLLPLLFLCYAVAYVDRTNVSIASLTMTKDLPGFNNEVIGLGAGVFFIGYFLLEIPGTLLVERWSARKWISRIMISWGIVAALTAFVEKPWHFYLARFLLGLAEAGFFPGVIVYLTHWFPTRDRARALSWFLIATPIAQAMSPLLSGPLIKIGADERIRGVTVHRPEVLGFEGWQWVYIAWGIPAIVLGALVFFLLTDRPRHALWLTPEERDALASELDRERAQLKSHHGHLTWSQALRHPRVLVLAAAYFFIVTGSYGVEMFLPKILEKWYSTNYTILMLLLVIPPLGGLLGQRFVGWNSDRTGERRLHAAMPIYMGAAALAMTVFSPRPLPLPVAVALFTLAVVGLKAYLPAFWTLPSLFLTEAAAASSIGLINSVGNLGGFVGPIVLGWVEHRLHTFRPGVQFLAVSMTISATIIMALGLGRRAKPPQDAEIALRRADTVIEPA